MITVADDTVDNKLVDKVNRAIKAMLENKQIEANIEPGHCQLIEAMKRTGYSWQPRGFRRSMETYGRTDRSMTVRTYPL